VDVLWRWRELAKYERTRSLLVWVMEDERKRKFFFQHLTRSSLEVEESSPQG
jgi:hypothetical protein